MELLYRAHRAGFADSRSSSALEPCRRRRNFIFFRDSLGSRREVIALRTHIVAASLRETRIRLIRWHADAQHLAETRLLAELCFPAGTCEFLVPLFCFHAVLSISSRGLWGFEQTFGSPTKPQIRGWPAIQSSRHALIAAPTGRGKPLAAFLASLDMLFREGAEDHWPDETRVVYVSPLKALSNDIRKNVQEPLAGIRAGLGEAKAARSMCALKCAPAIRLRRTRP